VRVIDLAAQARSLPQIEYMQGSILDRAAMQRALEGIDCVYHLAGIAHLWSGRTGEHDRVNRGGTEILLSLAKQQGVRRVVHCSSHTILLPSRKAAAQVDETIAVDYADLPGPYTRSKYLAEQAALSSSCAEMSVVVVNPTVPVGPGDDNFTPPAAMLARYLAGSRLYLECMMNIIDVRDLALGMILAAQHGRPGERYILGGENVSLQSILALVAHITGRQHVPIGVAGPLALAVGIVSEWVANLTGRSPLAVEEGVRLALRSSPFSIGKAHRELGFRPRPAQEALAAAALWLLSHSTVRSQARAAGIAESP
jgi:dihydroflavonol-4-reductase